MTQDSARQDLIKELREYFFDSDPFDKVVHIDDVVDFVLEDRRRIVEPLVKLPNKDKIAYQDYVAFTTDAINQTLKNAGY